MRFRVIKPLNNLINLLSTKLSFINHYLDSILFIFEENFFFWKVFSFSGQYWFNYNFKITNFTIINTKKY